MTLIPYLIRELIQRRKVTIVLFHELSPERADIDFNYLKRAYNIISLKNYLNARCSGKIWKLPPKSLIITFDDGHRSNYLLKSLIKKHNIPITTFLCSEIVGTNRQFWSNYDKIPDKEKLKICSDEERLKLLANLNFDELKESDNRMALSDEEIDDLRNTGLVDFQSHTQTHPSLIKCSYQKARREIFESKKQLEKDYDIRVFALSYPYGNYSDREMELVKQAGYKCAITVDPGFNDAKTDLFKLKRLDAYDLSDTNELAVKVSGLWIYMKIFIIGRIFGYESIGLK